jgi:hypothetical protein
MRQPFIHLTSTSGFVLLLFTLFCSASLWLLLLLELNPASHLAALQRHFGPPSSSSSATIRSDSFDKNMSQAVATSRSYVSGPIKQIDPHAKSLVISSADSSGHVTEIVIQLSEKTLFAKRPQTYNGSFTPMTFTALSVGQYVVAQSSIPNNNPFPATVILADNPVSPVPPYKLSPITLPVVNHPADTSNLPRNKDF